MRREPVSTFESPSTDAVDIPPERLAGELEPGGRGKTARLLTAVIEGVEGLPVWVEADLATALPSFLIVGMADTAVREARERVRAAVRNAGFRLPPRRMTVNLAPADRRKEGAGLDLPIALALLTAAELVEPARLDGTVVLGELALDGGVRPTTGVLPRLLSARDSGATRALVPLGNLPEASLVKGLRSVGVERLEDAAAWLGGQEVGTPAGLSEPRVAPRRSRGPDLADVRGQEQAKHALVTAAAGRHTLLLSGPPGAGKTMLARCLPGILPPLSDEEALEVLAVRSAAGLGVEVLAGLPVEAPLRAPHHTVSTPALVGGGRPLRPGEISLAHRGVLFLDELPEFGRGTLEALREPLEDGRVRIRRVHGSWELPARLMLVATMNPCPCGHAGSADCVCTRDVVLRYRNRLSGPLRDRLDLVIRVDPVPYEALAASRNSEAMTSEEARQVVLRARAAQEERFADRPPGSRSNSRMSSADLRRWAWPDSTGRALLARSMRAGMITARGHDRVLRVARTLADIEGAEAVELHHVMDALNLRRSARDLDEGT